MSQFNDPEELTVRIPVGDTRIEGDLALSADSTGLVLFAHGSGSSRQSVRNRYVAHTLQQHGFATLLVDLLTPGEEDIDRQDARFRFDIDRLAGRLVAIIDWLRKQDSTASLPIGLFGASTGAAAALVAAVDRPGRVYAVVSRGGRPDLAGDALGRVVAPTLLIVGALDTAVLAMNRAARAKLRGPVALEIVPGAGHLFEEPGALSDVADLAADWFHTYVMPSAATSERPSAIQ
ncbi:MAG: dienelactone hydrolase family protein [Acidobacteriota bacterium]